MVCLPWHFPMTPLPPTQPRAALTGALDQLLQPQLFKDYGPNGLQVEGRERVGLVVSGVTASLALIDAAIDAGAHALVVHHGLFWRGQDGCVTGWMKQRLARLLAHDINLYAYHLPLDAHADWGNNAQWGARLGFVPDQPGWARFGDQNLGFLGRADHPHAAALAAHVAQVMGRQPVVVGPLDRPIRRAAWCSGGAQGYFEAAIAEGVDVFLTGEISEPQAHYARECGVPFLACGHHASERYGAPAVASQVCAQLGLAHVFIDIDNPA
ncbi:MAG: hypothetical protein RJA09_1915 [Pseudomonadota bacterium]